MDKIYYLVGGGRSVHTKAARRTKRFLGRVIRIGGLVLRPNRRVSVNAAFLAKYAEDIKKHIQTGGIIVQHDADNFVDLEEFTAIVGGAPVDNSLPGKVDTGEGDDNDEGEDEDDADEEDDEAEGEGEKDGEGEDDLDDGADETTSPGTKTVQAATPNPLPHGWERMAKRELLVLCQERGVTADEMTTNREIVELLKAWAEEQEG